MTTQALRIGLTGGIGSGKSTVAGLLASHGAAIIDTDAIARRLTLPGGAAIPAIREAFGESLIDASGAMDRERMRSLAFADPQAKKGLEAILHPLIAVETARAAQASHAAVKVFDVPLLVESGRWRAIVDRVLVVDCSIDTQIERVMRRAGWAEEAVRRVIAQQATRDQRRACADAVILNDALSLEQLADEVSQLWARWCTPA